MIGEKTFIKGTIRAEEPLTILGRIQGHIESTKEITVGESGRVEADISGESVRVSGQVQGTVYSSDLFRLHRSGQMKGDVHSPRIQIEEGSVFQGSIDMSG